MKSQVECESFLLRIALMSLHSEQYKATPQLNIHLGTMMRNWSSMGRETPIVTFISWNVKRFESHPLCFSFFLFFFARSLFACAELAVTVSRLTQCDVISYLPEQLSFFCCTLDLSFNSLETSRSLYTHFCPFVGHWIGNDANSSGHFSVLIASVLLVGSCEKFYPCTCARFIFLGVWAICHRLCSDATVLFGQSAENIHLWADW